MTNAQSHVNILAGTIGSRPAGTDANRRAREYIIDQLRLFGFDVRVQEADAVRSELGQTAHVINIVATKPGSRPQAIALVAHYDSTPDSPGAADDGLGVAVCLEAGRLLASRPHPAYTLAIVLTDGEELGLMGAAAFLQDPLIKQIRAYLNFEAVGTAGPGVLFQAGPGNPWLVRAWSRHALVPAGGSYATEIYKRLPNDTDFTVLQRAGIPGLNFAAIGDSYAYHTRLDAAERLSPATLLQTGANALAIVEALDRTDLGEPSGDTPMYLDVNRTWAVAFGPTGGLALVALSVVFGLVAWIRVLASGSRHGGIRKVVVAAFWGVVALGVAAACLVGASWLVREAREVYHPWYAHPDRYFTLLVLAGVFGVWVVRRVRLWLPRWARGGAGPAVAWSLALPAWVALALGAQWQVPAAAYLAAVPLLAAGVLLTLMPLGLPTSVRIASTLVLGVTGALWIRPAVELLHFAVPAFGRMTFITPVSAYPALILAAGLYLAPPLVAIVAGEAHKRWARRASAAALLLALALSAVSAYMAPAYSEQRPLRRVARYIEDLAEGRAYWEVASTEPGLDLPGRAPSTESWQVVQATAPVSFPVGPPGPTFAFRARTTTLEAPPVEVQGEVTGNGEQARLEVTAFPRNNGLFVAFGLPAGVVPLEANLAGRLRAGRWVAAYAAPPPEGVTFRARFPASQAEQLKGVRVLVIEPGLPGGEGWQQLPGWLNSARAVWTARSYYILPAVR